MKMTPPSLKVIIDQPGFQLYWRQRELVFTRSFRDYIEQLESLDGSSLTELYN
jgi:hypothetical protein